MRHNWRIFSFPEFLVSRIYFWRHFRLFAITPRAHAYNHAAQFSRRLLRGSRCDPGRAGFATHFGL